MKTRINDLFKQKKYAEILQLIKSTPDLESELIKMAARNFADLNLFDKAFETLDCLKLKSDWDRYTYYCDRANLYSILFRRYKDPQYLDQLANELNQLPERFASDEFAQMMWATYYLNQKNYSEALSFTEAALKRPTIRIAHFVEHMLIVQLTIYDRLNNNQEQLEKVAQRLFDIAKTTKDQGQKLKIFYAIARSKSKLIKSAELTNFINQKIADTSNEQITDENNGNLDNEFNLKNDLNLARVLEENGKRDEAFNELKKIVDRHNTNPTFEVWTACINIAFLLQQDDNPESYRESITYLELLLKANKEKRFEKAFLPTTQQLVHAYNSLAIGYMGIMDRAKAKFYEDEGAKLAKTAGLNSTKAKIRSSRVSTKTHTNIFEKNRASYAEGMKLDRERFERKHKPHEQGSLIEVVKTIDESPLSFPTLTTTSVEQPAAKVKLGRIKKSKMVTLAEWEKQKKEEPKEKAPTVNNANKKSKKKKAIVGEKNLAAENNNAILPAEESLISAIPASEEKIVEEKNKEEEIKLPEVEKAIEQNDQQEALINDNQKDEVATEVALKTSQPINVSKGANVSTNRSCFFATAVAVAAFTVVAGTSLYTRWNCK